MSRAQDHPSLAGRRILVVEDEVLIALDLESLLMANGCSVLGPVNTVTAALSIVGEDRLDAALLDLNLGGQPSTPVAAELKARGIPFLVVTAYGRSAMQMDEFHGAPIIDKPIDYAELLGLLERAIARGP
ncbi:MAG TPA: response regulator [Steroidobacteraceae bacterium]|nr:response regulator [Steroidobacteraceae bacterium]